MPAWRPVEKLPLAVFAVLDSVELVDFVFSGDSHTQDETDKSKNSVDC